MTPDQIATKSDIAELRDMLAEAMRKLDAATVTRDESGWMTRHAAAGHFGVSLSTIDRWIANGTMEPRGSGKGREVRKV